MRARWAYFDTSVFVKRYAREPGSARARALLGRYRFLSSAITPVEAISALCRRRAAGELAERSFAAILSRLRRDRAYWELVEVSPLLLNEAEAVIQKTSVRTLDALHLASVIVFRAASGIQVPFITADSRQRDAAGQLALEVVWAG